VTRNDLILGIDEAKPGSKDKSAVVIARKLANGETEVLGSGIHEDFYEAARIAIDQYVSWLVRDMFA